MKLVLAALLLVSTAALALDPPVYEKREIAGWTVQVNVKLIPSDAPALEKALTLLRAQLDEIVRVVPAKAVAELRKVPLYFNPEYSNAPPRAEYHPGAEWLRNNGRDPAMAKGVEFSNVRIFEAETRRMPNFALHELAHAYHDRVLGFENSEIEAAFQQAKTAGKHDSVLRQDAEGHRRLGKAYAMTNAKEYFAECTEAFFTRNDFFPFTAGELQQHDPAMFVLLARLWGTPQAQAELKALRSQATAGDVKAQMALAYRYRDGTGVNKDAAEAMNWAHRAADAGDADAMDFIGFAYLRGNVINRNPVIAFGYFKAAAERSTQAAFNLGQCYFGAQGTEQDIPKALEYWKKAAAGGNGRAAANAAMIYLSGEGVPPDAVQARQLAERAAALEEPSGLVVLGEMQFQAGELEVAKANWTRAAKLKPVGPTGHPAQPSANASAQQGADLLKLIDYRRRRGEPGKFAFVPMPHIHQGYNNCGSTACATFARFQGSTLGGWDFKRLCPSPLGTGTDWGHLLDASKKIGQQWKLITFTPDDNGFSQATAFLKSELDAGRPVVVDFKYIGPQYPNGSAGHTPVSVATSRRKTSTSCAIPQSPPPASSSSRPMI